MPTGSDPSGDPEFARLRLFDLPIGDGTRDLAKAAAEASIAPSLTLDFSGTEDWTEEQYATVFKALAHRRVEKLSLSRTYFSVLGDAVPNDKMRDATDFTYASHEVVKTSAVVRGLVLGGLPRALKSFSFSDAGLGPTDLRALLPAVPGSLENLNVISNNLELDGLDALGAARLECLSELAIGWDGFGNLHAERIAGTSIVAQLSRLSLYAPAMTDAGARAVAETPHLEGLSHLSVHAPALTKAGWTALRRRFGDRMPEQRR